MARDAFSPVNGVEVSMNGRLWVCFVAWTFAASASVQAGSPTTAAEYIAAVEGAQQPDRGGFDSLTLEQLMTRFKVPGVSIAVIRDFNIHWAKAYGVADADTGAKVDTNTLFQAASISKPVTAMAVLKAAQDGKLSLDEDVNKYLRSWKLPNGPHTASRPVTARMLASHTSGLGDGFGFPGYNPADPVPTPAQILNGQAPSNVGAVLMERPPLTAMKYSGGGYTILQLMLIDVYGRPFAQTLQASVLGPIGMSNSTFEQPLSAARDQNATRGHDNAGRPMGAKWHVYPELAAAGLWTTPTDLAKFAIEIQKSIQGQSNQVLSRATVQEMVSPVGLGDFGVGLSLEKRGQGWYFSHGGGNWGFVCLMMAHKAKGYGFVVMTNSYSGPLTNEIRERIERAYTWDSLDKPVPR
jgi:CubicO group peptidase (beta-lactamase class C family)